ncbi:hypothetical protein HYW21_05240 [Candidatus Woesearchaeota archaeon]|nr:hypothetical protein [Candidatus Woesearchaeota archaeon]
MTQNLYNLTAQARAEERLRRVRTYAATPIHELLAERQRRGQLEPPIPIIDESVDRVVVNYDHDTWTDVIDFYRLVDQRRRTMGLQTRPVRTSDGVRGVTSSHIDDVAEALLRFRKYFATDFGGNRSPSLLDLGCFDGRVVVLAHLLGYRAEGIEIDGEGYRECLGIVRIVENIIPGLERAVHITNGDYTTTDGIRGLRTRVGLVDCFFNYDDTNVDKVATLMYGKGKPGARLLLNTYAEHRDEIPLTLTHMVRTSHSHEMDGIVYPTFDVFVKR